MRIPPDRLADVVRYCSVTWPGASVLSLTSAATGLPALGELDLGALPVLVSLRYDAVPGLAPDGLPLPDENEQLARAGQASSFDVVMLDPFHTLDSSLAGIRAALAAARPASVVLVHDCLPPAELRAPEYEPDDWCGVTHQAFVDVAVDGDRDWCTLDADFGIGMFGPAGSRCAAGDDEGDLHRRWRAAASHDERAAMFDAHGPALVRAATPAAAVAQLDAWVDVAADPARAAERALRRRLLRLEARLGTAAERAEQAVGELAAESCRRHNAEARLAEAEARLAVTEATLAAAQARADAAAEAVAALRASPTFRLGRGLTAPVRAVRRRAGGAAPG